MLFLLKKVTMSLSSRQAAITLGYNWYMPDEPCKHCNTYSMKRVSNSECKGCLTRPRILATTYFTGIPCRNGHVSRRYSSNRHCVACDRLR